MPSPTSTSRRPQPPTEGQRLRYLRFIACATSGFFRASAQITCGAADSTFFATRHKRASRRRAITSSANSGSLTPLLSWRFSASVPLPYGLGCSLDAATAADAVPLAEPGNSARM